MALMAPQVSSRTFGSDRATLGAGGGSRGGSMMSRHPSSIRRPSPPSIPRIQSLITSYLSPSPTAPSPPTPSVATLSVPSSQPMNSNGSSTSSSGNIKSQLSNALREALHWSIVKADITILDFLLALEGPAADLLNTQARIIQDPDHNLLTSISIIAAAGSGPGGAGGGGTPILGGLVGGVKDREEVVRVLVRRWGIIDGVSGEEGDIAEGKAPWHPLHLAALLSSPPLISFLLTQGASPHCTTSKGLTPLDLVSGMTVNQRDEVAILLSGAMEGEVADGLASEALEFSGLGEESMETDSFGGTTSRGLGGGGVRGLSLRRQQMLERHRANKAAAEERRVRREERRRVEFEKDGWVRRVLGREGEGGSVEFLMHDYEDRRRGGREEEEIDLEEEEDEDENGDGERVTRGHGREGSGFEGMEVFGSEHSEDDRDGHASAEIDDSSILVFSLSHLPVILDVLIASYPPQCFPLSRRTLPANAIYLCAKFALHRCDAGWLVGFLEGATVEIERVCLTRTNDMIYLAFWVYNLTILVHLIQSDEIMLEACEEVNLLVMLEEMLNALQVHIIRIAETKIDRLFETALLDYETMEDFADVRFDDEWAIFRGLTGKPKRKQQSTHDGRQSDLQTPQSSPGRHLDRSVSSATTASALSKHASLAEVGSPRGTMRHLSDMSVEDDSPQSITEILSSTLLVLQLYEVNPALIVQMFSQIFLWMACEIFNRIIAGGKKYLCRIKAVQIKLNITALEDWVRGSALPPAIFGKHFDRVVQLLQWLQCSSQLKDFDMLIATMQNMSALNPLQMRRAVKDYRFEVNESRMSEECAQYLEQLQRDWERRRVRIGVEAIQRQVNLRKGGDTSQPTSPTLVDPGSSIDTLFDPDMGISEYIPPAAPPSIGELEESRFMIPLSLPANQYLRAVTPVRAVSRNSITQSPFVSPSPGGRPSSRTSFLSSRPLEWTLRSDKRIRALPDEFIPWLRAAQSMSEAHLLGRGRGGHTKDDSISASYEIVGMPGYPSSIVDHRGQRHGHHTTSTAIEGMPPHRTDSPVRMHRPHRGSGSSGSPLTDSRSQNANIPAGGDLNQPRARVKSDPSRVPNLYSPKEDRFGASIRIPSSPPGTERTRRDSLTYPQSHSPEKSRWWKPKSRLASDSTVQGSENADEETTPVASTSAPGDRWA